MQIHSAKDSNAISLATELPAEKLEQGTQSTTSWQQLLSNVDITVEQLLERLVLTEQWPLSAMTEANRQFPLRVPKPYIEKMQLGNPRDPLLAQVLPGAEELEITPGYSADPLQEQASNPLPGLIHKYHGRVLLLASRACAIHCRYCFRRHFPYEDNQPSRKEWKQALTYIERDPSISELILSGGDPLAASDTYLTWLLHELGSIPHLKRLRIHSRLPVVLPQRVTPSMLNWLSNWTGQKVIVIHCNHARELGPDVHHALDLLRQTGATLLNQSVLLKGVNDSVETLAELSEALFNAHVLPYYLHQLDPVTGTAHFAVPDSRAKRLVGQLSGALPGYMVPKLVREIAGMRAKTPLLPIL